MNIIYLASIFILLCHNVDGIDLAANSYESMSAENSLLLDDKMKKSILDIVEDPFEEEGRFFDYDRGAAFNTSVAFTIPLFSFTLPGAVETAETGVESNSFGVLAFTALFLLAGLGVAIYTTAQGGNGDALADGRIFGDENAFTSRLLQTVYDSISGLPEALDVDNCSKLAVCSAHAESEKYGLLSLPFRFFFPVYDEPANHLTEYEKASLYGYKNEDECYYEYPCIVNPLDTIMYLKDYFISK